MTFDPVATLELIEAARFADVARMRVALKAGADPDAQCPASGSLVCLAAMANDGNDEMLAVLLDAGANPNVAGKFNRSALTTALMEPYIVRAEMLIAAGADINFQPLEEKGNTILFDAIISDIMLGVTERTEFVLSHKPDLHRSVQREEGPVVHAALIAQNLAELRAVAPGVVDTIDKIEKLVARYAYDNPSPQELQERASAQARAANIKNKIKDTRYKL